MLFDYPVTLTPDEGSVLVTFADVPDAITFGADEEEALLQAVDALESGPVHVRANAQSLARARQAQRVRACTRMTGGACTPPPMPAATRPPAASSTYVPHNRPSHPEVTRPCNPTRRRASSNASGPA